MCVPEFPALTLGSHMVMWGACITYMFMWVCPYTCTRKPQVHIEHLLNYLLNLFFAVKVSYWLDPPAYTPSLSGPWNAGFYVDAVDSDTGPQACPAGTLLIEPSLRLAVCVLDCVLYPSHVASCCFLQGIWCLSLGLTPSFLLDASCSSLSCYMQNP